MLDVSADFEQKKIAKNCEKVCGVTLHIKKPFPQFLRFSDDVSPFFFMYSGDEQKNTRIFEIFANLKTLRVRPRDPTNFQILDMS